MTDHPVSTNSSLHVRAPSSLTSALRDEREMTTASEYARRALIAQLRADGIDPVARGTFDAISSRS